EVATLLGEHLAHLQGRGPAPLAATARPRSRTRLRMAVAVAVLGVGVVTAFWLGRTWDRPDPAGGPDAGGRLPSPPAPAPRPRPERHPGRPPGGGWRRRPEESPAGTGRRPWRGQAPGADGSALSPVRGGDQPGRENAGLGRDRQGRAPLGPGDREDPAGTDRAPAAGRGHHFHPRLQPGRNAARLRRLGGDGQALGGPPPPGPGA